MTNTSYAAQVTQYYLAALAAYEAAAPGTGAPLNISDGAVVLGDGGGSLSALIAAGNVTSEVYSGQLVNSVAVDSINAAQLDITIVVPAVNASGVEVGPFTINEIAIFDALGNCCAVATTNLQKTVSSQGQTSDLVIGVGVVGGVAGSVNVTPPSFGFATVATVILGVNANLPTAVAPLTTANSTSAGGWVNRVFGIAKASQPTDATTAADAAAMGVGRPATNAEFTAGSSESGGFLYPWTTIQQVTGAIWALAAAAAANLASAVASLTGAIAATLTAANAYALTLYSPTRILGVQSTQTITFGANETRARIRGNGAGGGGGGANGSGAAGSGGGGAPYIDIWVTGQIAGATLAFSLGANGVAGSASPSNGTAGGTTTITGAGVSVSMTGGGAGLNGNGGLQDTTGAGGVATISGANVTVIETLPGSFGGIGYVTSSGPSGGAGGLSPRSGVALGPNIGAAGQHGFGPGVGGNGGANTNAGGAGAAPSFTIELYP